MTREQLSALVGNLEELAGMPNGVSLLQDLILHLAVTGQLSEQRETDGTGHDLLTDLSPRIAGKKRAKRRSGSSSPVESARFAGEIPDSWALPTLGDLSELITDGTHHTPTYVSSGVRFLSIKDVSGGVIDFSNTRYIAPEEHEQLCRRVRPQRGDVLFCRIGTLGRPVVVDTDEPFSIFVSLGLIRVDPDRVDPDYLTMVLSSPEMKQIYERVKARGSHTNKLNLATMPLLPIPLPPTAEQRRIVETMQSFRHLVDELRLQLSFAENARMDLRSSYFRNLGAGSADKFALLDDVVQTRDDVDALRVAIIDAAVSGRLDPDNADNSETAEEWELGVSVLPAGWQWSTLGAVSSYLQRGKSPKYADAGSLSVISQKCVRWGGLDMGPARIVSDATLSKYAEDRYLRPGDLLINSTGGGTVGRACLFPKQESSKIVADSHVTVARLTGISPEFIELWFRSSHVQDKVEDVWATGSTNQIEWNLSSLRALPVPLPPRPLQDSIVARVHALLEELVPLETLVAEM